MCSLFFKNIFHSSINIQYLNTNVFSVILTNKSRYIVEMVSVEKNILQVLLEKGIKCYKHTDFWPLRMENYQPEKKLLQSASPRAIFYFYFFLFSIVEVQGYISGTVIQD